MHSIESLGLLGTELNISEVIEICFIDDSRTYNYANISNCNCNDRPRYDDMGSIVSSKPRLGYFTVLFRVSAYILLRIRPTEKVKF